MPEADDLALLTEAARAAGELACRYTGPAAEAWHKPDGAGPVTEADLAVNALLSERLLGARPDYGWLSEEDADDPARRARARCFIVDPIDGTRSFIEGSNTWAHSLAVAEAGQIVAGVVFLPARGKLYAARRGGGAWLNGAPIAASRRSGLEQAEVLVTRPALAPHHWPRGVPPLRRGHRPSLAYRLALVAEGRFDAMVTFRPSWEWDIAAGSLIAEEAGARVTDRHGRPLRFNEAPRPQTDGVLAGGAGVHAALLEAMGEAAHGP